VHSEDSDEVKCAKDIFKRAGAHIDRWTNGAYGNAESMPNIENCAEPACGVRSAGKVITLKGLRLLTRDAFFQWIDDNPFQMGAALAYYTLFSIAPLLLIAIAVAGSVFGRDASQVQIIGAIQDIVGFHSARAVLAMIENAGQTPDSGFFATAAGMILLLLGAAGVIGQLQDSLNAIWRVASKTGRGILGFGQDRLVSYSIVLGVGFLLVDSLVVNALLTAVSGIVSGFLPIDAVAAHILGLVVSFVFIALLFAVIYKFVPDVRIAGRDVWIGAATAHCCFRSANFLSAFIWATAWSHRSTARPVLW
jgi:membrane protein